MNEGKPTKKYVYKVLKLIVKIKDTIFYTKEQIVYSGLHICLNLYTV